MKNYNTKEGYLTVPQAEKRAISLFRQYGIMNPKNIYKKIHQEIKNGNLESEAMGKRMKQVQQDSLDNWVLSLIKAELGQIDDISNLVDDRANSIEILEDIKLVINRVNTKEMTIDEAQKVLRVIKKLI